MLHETYAILAEALSDPTPCLPPGFSGPVSTALGWVKALSLVIGVVALVRDRKSTRLNSSHSRASRMPSSA